MFPLPQDIIGSDLKARTLNKLGHGVAFHGCKGYYEFGCYYVEIH